MRKTLRTQSGALHDRAGARPACVRPPTPRNYSADAGEGSNTITVIGESAGWRGALLGTVAAGALLLYSARSARAGPDLCDLSGASPNQTATCEGDQSDGIASGTDFIAADVETLIVNNLDQNIAPAVNVDGIRFVRVGAGNGINIYSDTGVYDIVTTGTGDGIYAQADGTIVIDHAGDINAGDNGIYARTDLNAVDLSITATGTITGGDYGILARNYGSGALSIVANGDVEGTDFAGIYARNDAVGTDLSIETEGVTGGILGIRAHNFGSGALSIVANGDVEGTSYAGIYARNSAGGTDLSIESAAVTGGNYGIDARNFGDGALDIVANGDVEGTDANSVGIYALNSVAGTDLTIETAAVTGDDFGIRALNYGDGAIDIVANGDVEGINNDGIFARNGTNVTPAGTDLTIESQGVTGGDFGINARNYGSGALAIVAGGDVEGTAVNSYGIFALNYLTGTDLSIQSAGVTGGNFGIYARNFGTGALSITATAPSRAPAPTAPASMRGTTATAPISASRARPSPAAITVLTPAISAAARLRSSPTAMSRASTWASLR